MFFLYDTTHLLKSLSPFCWRFSSPQCLKQATRISSSSSSVQKTTSNVVLIMKLPSISSLALIASSYFSLIAGMPLEERGAGVCSGGIYGELVPILIKYPIAQAFCSAAYPVSCTTAPRAKEKRVATTTTTTTKAAAKTTVPSTTTTKAAGKATAPVTTTTSTRTSTTTVDARSSAWSKCQKQPRNVISTVGLPEFQDICPMRASGHSQLSSFSFDNSVMADSILVVLMYRNPSAL